MNIKLTPIHTSPDSTSNTMVSTADLNDTVIKTELPPRKTMDVKPPVAKKERTRIRKRVNTAEKRASHNAVERQRRETLNSKFLVS